MRPFPPPPKKNCIKCKKLDLGARCWHPLDPPMTQEVRLLMELKQAGPQMEGIQTFTWKSQDGQQRTIGRAHLDSHSEINFITFKYRSGTVNSKSFVGEVFLQIKWKYELTVHFKHEIIGKSSKKLRIKWNFELTVSNLYVYLGLNATEKAVICCLTVYWRAIVIAVVCVSWEPDWWAIFQ